MPSPASANQDLIANLITISTSPRNIISNSSIWNSLVSNSEVICLINPLISHKQRRNNLLLFCPHPIGFPDSSVGKESTCNAGDPGSIPGSGRCPGEGIGYPVQYSWASLVAQLVKNPPAQDIKLTHRNPLHSYTLTMKKQKEKLRKQYHSPLQQKE